MIHVQVLIPNTIDDSEANRILTHQSLSMKQAKGNIEAKLSRGAIMSPGGPTPYSMAMTAKWDSLENFIAWAQSPDGDKYKDVLLENGATMVFYEAES